MSEVSGKLDVETKASMAARLGCQGCLGAATLRAEGLLSCMVAVNALGGVEGLPFKVSQTITTTVQHPSISNSKPTVMDTHIERAAPTQPCPQEWCGKLPQIAYELAGIMEQAGIPKNVIQIDQG